MQGGNLFERRDIQAFLHFHLVSISSLQKMALLKENKSASITRTIAEMIAKVTGMSDKY
ncbi:MAG: hypothetical protein ACXVI4_01880 [Halobacteriota archaeon]